MSLLALRPSHRGVRLHTFEPEDRGYTSTPTKIGGHCLDHVRNGFTVIRQLRNKHSASVRTCSSGGGRNGQSQQASSRDSGGGEHEAAGMEGRPAAAFSTTLDTGMGRFGGLSAGLVLRLGPADFVPHHHRLYPTLADFPPDTLAPRRDAGDGFSCQQQQQQAHDDPKWRAGESDGVDPPASTIAPRHGGNGGASPPAAAADDAREEIRAVPYRDMATTAATGHSGALMAILLSRLAAVNPGDAYTSDTPASAAAAAGGLVRDNSSVGLGVAKPGSTTALIATDEVLRRPPADSAAHGHGGGGSRGGGSWAWKARVDPLPVSSKLKRYDFVRELGSGSHGTLLLVRKRPLSAAANSGSGGALGANSSHAGAGGRRRRGGAGGRGLNPGSIGSSSGTCSSQPGGNLRVLKESHFLPEAVNEARLLLLAGGGGGGGGAAYATGSGFGYERQMAGGGGGAEGPETYGGNVDTGDDVVATATAVRDGGGVEGRQRGEVVKLHDFFVETVGHRSFAFLELEYCEGGDLASLILGSRAGGGSTAGAENSAATATPTAAAAPARGGALRDFAYRFPAQPLEGPATAVAREESTGGGGGGGGSAGDFFSGDRRKLGAGGGGFDDQRRSHSGAAAVAAMGQDARAPLAGLPAARIGRVALGLCEGLQRLHERGILHRDLKPANVLLTKNGAVRVADLGVSTCLDPSRPLTENAAGTIPFMAPEVRKYLLGSKVAYSGKADVWAVGALVYAMAVGDPAPAELATEPRERLVAAIGRWTGSEALSHAAHRALDPDPSRRPSVHQMTTMLQSCCEREGWLSQHKHPPGSRGQGLVPRARL